MARCRGRLREGREGWQAPGGARCAPRQEGTAEGGLFPPGQGGGRAPLEGKIGLTQVLRPSRLVDQIRDAIEVHLHAPRPVRCRASPPERAEEVKPVWGVLEQAVQVDAGDVALTEPEAVGQVR